jgi:hypothetical protein
LTLRPTLVVASAVLLAAGLSSVAFSAPSAPVAAPASSGASSAAAKQAPAPAFLLPTSARGQDVPAQRAVRGTSSLVSLSTQLLPRRAAGQRLSFNVGNRVVTGTIDAVDTDRGATAWSGTLDVAQGSFTIAQAGDVFRASVLFPGGRYAVTQASGDLYWLTDVAPPPTSEETDAYTEETAAKDGAGVDDLPWSDTATRPVAQAGSQATAERRKKGKQKVTVLFAYDKTALAQAGSKKALKAAMAQVVAETNYSFKNSGIKAKIKSRGLIRSKGKPAADLSNTLTRLYNPFDGQFDSARFVQKRKKADLVHLFVGGTVKEWCGFGNLPYKPSTTSPRFSASVSNLACLPYLTVTHELGHNLGADHDRYPGVSHSSKLKYAYGYIDVANGFGTIMSYPNACLDADVYCTTVPWYSSPKKPLPIGLPTGTKKQDNAKAIKKTIGKVANYNGRW